MLDKTKQKNVDDIYAQINIDTASSNTYNVTANIPLVAGSYYTPTTARASVPAENRKLGLNITYAIASNTWVVEQFIGDDILSWTTAVNWSFIIDKAFFVSNEANKYVNFNFNTNLVEFPNGYFSIGKGDYKYKAASSVSLHATEVNFLYYNFASNVIMCWPHSIAAVNMVSYPKIGLLGVFNKTAPSISLNGQYRINGVNTQTFNFLSRTTNTLINISFATNQVIIPNGWVSKGNGDFTATSAQTVAMTAGAINFLYYDYTSNTFLCWGHSVAATNIVSYPNAYLLAIMNGSIPSVSATAQYIINGVVMNRVYDDNDLAFITATDTDLIDFNLLTNKINIPAGWVSKGKGDFTAITAQIINITPNEINWLYYDYTSNTFLCWGHSVAATNIVSYPNARILAVFKDEIKNINIRCRYKINGYRIEDYRFDTTVNKLILPSDMFFIDDVEIPIYKEQMVVDNSYDEKYKSVLVTTDSVGRIKPISFEECVNIKGSDITALFKLAIINQRPYNDSSEEFYYRDIIKHSIASSSLQGKNPKILLIGDSIIQRYVPQYVYTYLTELGVDPVMLGTVDNLLTVPTQKSEGIGGWKLSALVGASTGGVYDVGGAKFMRLANATDKANHPTWCFRRTNALLEKNYTTDIDKTGNFYIFDLQSYLTTNSFSTPDVITLAMSVNDIANDMGAFATEADFIAAMMVYVDIFVTKVNEVDPNIKIGISPNLLYPNSYYFNISRKTAITYLEKVMAFVEANKVLYPNLYVIPAWLHISREFSYMIDSETNFNTDNHAKIAKILNVHPSSAGGWEFAKSISVFISNMI